MVGRAVHAYRPVRREREVDRCEDVLHATVASPDVARRHTCPYVPRPGRPEVKVAAQHRRLIAGIARAYVGNGGVQQVGTLRKRDGQAGVGQMRRAGVKGADGVQAQPGALLRIARIRRSVPGCA